MIKWTDRLGRVTGFHSFPFEPCGDFVLSWPAEWGKSVWLLASIGRGHPTSQDTPVLGDKESMVISSGEQGTWGNCIFQCLCPSGGGCGTGVGSLGNHSSPRAGWGAFPGLSHHSAGALTTVCGSLCTRLEASGLIRTIDFSRQVITPFGRGETDLENYWTEEGGDGPSVRAPSVFQTPEHPQFFFDCALLLPVFVSY